MGIEADRGAVAEGLAAGLPVRSGDPADFGGDASEVDGIHAYRILETLDGEDARRFLEGCAERIVPGGRLVLRTRDWRAPEQRSGDFWEDPSTRRPYPLGLVEQMALSAGFSIERRGHESCGGHDSYIVAVREPRPATESGPSAGAGPRASHGDSTDRPRVVFEGSFFAAHSYSRVNRELASAWIREDRVELEVLPNDRRLPSAGGESADDPLLGRVHHPLSDDAEFHVRHVWPASFRAPARGRWIQIQPYEFGRIPASWVEPIRSSVDEIWVPSHYARRCYTESGIPVDRVAVVPNGVDATTFRPDAEPVELPTRKRFRFLFVGGSIWRKGIDVLLAAFREAFGRHDDVALVLKDACGDSFYKDRNAAESIRAFVEDPESPELIYVDQEIPEADMPGLYTACQALVHPYRGEGFGLPVIEALACGLPIVMTRGGACDEFAPDGAVFDVEARRRPIRPAGLTLAGDGWVLEPDPASLVRALRTAVERAPQLGDMGALGRQHVVDHFSWERAAELAALRLRALRERPVRRPLGRTSNAGTEDGTGALETAIQRLLLADPRGALEILQTEAAERPGDPLVRHWIGMAYRAGGDLDRARTEFQEALVADRNAPETWYNLGLLNVETGDGEAGRESMEIARELGLDHAALHNDLGVVYSAAGDADAAERSLRRAVERSPLDDDAVYNLGMVFAAQGRLDRAQDLIERTLARDSAHAGARSLAEALESMVTQRG